MYVLAWRIIMAARKQAEKSKSLPWGLTPEGLTPGSMKTISQNKLKAFSVGLMNAGLKKTNKVKQDLDTRKKKEEAECAEVFADFVASFEDNKTSVKTFVKGNTYNPETKEESSAEKGKLYKPAMKFQTNVEHKPKEDLTPKKPDLKKKSKEKEKKKSNLELFKEELKRSQEERELRHKIKRGELTDIPRDVLANLPPSLLETQKDDGLYGMSYGSHDTGDPNTTNLYIGNINPKMNEEMLMKLFGKYGPLASVKIMWPRTEEEKARNRNCGFVAYMRRKDGQKALDALKGKEIMEFEMKLGWGKSVPIPPQPIYVPPEMQEQSVPPPPSGLPFNGQPKKTLSQESKGCQEDGQLDPNGFNKETLANAVVKVVIPTERNLLMMIHRMVEFVVREGPMFEAMIMNREINNPMYRFLFDNQSPEHIYYRWRLFSILQGDSPQKWKTEKFRMFAGGSMWKPPPCHQYGPAGIATAPPPPAAKPVAEVATSQPEVVSSSSSSSIPAPSNSSSSSTSNKKSSLSSRQRDKFEDLLRQLTPERSRISACMVWCVDHADAAEEIVECIAESLSILETPLQSKIARLYLVSDILHNCSVKVPNVSYYRRGFESKLVEIFKSLQQAYSAINARMKAENFRKQIMRCLAAWMDWAVYPPGLIVNLQSIFLGQGDVGEQLEAAEYFSKPDINVDNKMVGDNIDGTPMSFDGVPMRGMDIDGMPMGGREGLDGVPLNSHGDVDGLPLQRSSDDLDGVPLTEGDLDGAPLNLDGVPMDEKRQEESFKKDLPQISSKWDHPEWESVEESEGKQKGRSQEQSPEGDILALHESTRTGVAIEMDESRRKKLREIELKVAEYAEKLEAKGAGKKGINIAEKCDHYRTKLLEAIEPTPGKESKSKKKKSRDLSSPSSNTTKRSRSRSRSPKRHRSRRKSDSSSSRSHSRSRSRSRSPLAVSLQSLKSYESRSPSPFRSHSPSPLSSSRSRRKSRSRSRSRSPKRKHRSRSSSPTKKSSRKRHSRSRSRSPPRKKSKKRKK